MCVNYMLEIIGLDEWELTHPLGATAYKLHRKLLFLANKERFPERLSVTNRLLMSLVGCSEDSLIKARQALINAGLIEYKGQKKVTPLYMIRYFSENPRYNPKNAGYAQGMEQGIKQGIKQDMERDIKQGTYPNWTEGNETGENPSGEEDIYNNTILPVGAARRRRWGPFPRRTGALGREEAGELEALRRWLELNPGARRMYGEEYALLQELMDSDAYPLALVGEAVTATWQRNQPPRGELERPLDYTMALLEDWKRRGVNSVEELRDEYIAANPAL